MRRVVLAALASLWLLAPGAEAGVGDRDAALQAWAEHFHPVEVGTREGTCPTRRLTLNQGKMLELEGRRYDGIRFRAPEAPGDLVWFFVKPRDGHKVQWYILPRKGTMAGFRTYFNVPRGFPTALPAGVDPAVNDVVVQHLPAGRLQPGQEYLIFFSFADRQPRVYHVGLNVVPLRRVPSDRMAHFMKVLGLLPPPRPGEGPAR